MTIVMTFAIGGTIGTRFILVLVLLSIIIAVSARVPRVATMT